jgi:pimeloyl-ACP methyl ester carboxylesterase
MSFYERGPVRIHYQEFGSGFPLLLIPGGGLNSTIAGLARGGPFNAIEEFKGEYRCIVSDLRNANGGQSSGPLEIDRPWDSYTDDHLGLMDHLRVDKFMVMGFCIGGPFVWNLLERAPDRIPAAVLAQPSGFRPEMPTLFYDNNMSGWGPEQISHQDVPHQPRLRLHRNPRFRSQLPDARTDPAGRYSGTSIRRGYGGRGAGAESRGEHVPVEGAAGADSAGSSADPFVPAGPSARQRLD